MDYFGEVEENAVIDFNNSNSSEERNKIYNDSLLIPFKKMIQCILRKYFTYLIHNNNTNKLEFDALTHLIDKISNFVPDTINNAGHKTKAFSYCQTIIKNYFIEYGKKIIINEKILNYVDYEEYISNCEEYSYDIETDNIEDKFKLLIIDIIIKIKEKLNDKKSLKRNDIIVGEAIIDILNNCEILFVEDDKIYKNNILLILREKTKLSTVEIRSSIKRTFKNIYIFEKNIFKI